MFYEGRVSTTWIIEEHDLKILFGKRNTSETKLSNGRNSYLYADVLFIVKINGRLIGFADDSTNANGISELAILDIDKMTQIESLTLGWCNDQYKSFMECVNSDFSMGSSIKVELDADYQIIKNTPVWFECGCCGQGFKSTQKEQAQFDQDTGYGICSNCL